MVSFPDPLQPIDIVHQPFLELLLNSWNWMNYVLEVLLVHEITNVFACKILGGCVSAARDTDWKQQHISLNIWPIGQL
jgi:hypothetical protein